MLVNLKEEWRTHVLSVIMSTTVRSMVKEFICYHVLRAHFQHFIQYKDLELSIPSAPIMNYQTHCGFTRYLVFGILVLMYMA